MCHYVCTSNTAVSHGTTPRVNQHSRRKHALFLVAVMIARIVEVDVDQVVPRAIGGRRRQQVVQGALGGGAHAVANVRAAAVAVQ